MTKKHLRIKRFHWAMYLIALLFTLGLCLTLAYLIGSYLVEGNKIMALVSTFIIAFNLFSLKRLTCSHFDLLKTIDRIIVLEEELKVFQEKAEAIEKEIYKSMQCEKKDKLRSEKE